MRSKNICKNHIEDFSDIVACNDCNMLGGYMLVNRSLHGAIYLQEDKQNFFKTEKEASQYAKKYAMGKSWKPIQIFIHFS